MTAAPQDRTRIERDALGEVEVPLDALWQAQTQRAVENFPISGRRVDPELIAAVVQVKRAAAPVNAGLDVIDEAVAAAIVTAADRVLAGHHDDQFPIDVFQTGSGTSTNMNVNEVLSSLATAQLGRPVHPNDDVNASQSSNDVIPTAIRLAALQSLHRRLVPSLAHLAASLRRRAAALRRRGEGGPHPPDGRGAR